MNVNTSGLSNNQMAAMMQNFSSNNAASPMGPDLGAQMKSPHSNQMFAQPQPGQNQFSQPSMVGRPVNGQRPGFQKTASTSNVSKAGQMNLMVGASPFPTGQIPQNQQQNQQPQRPPLRTSLSGANSLQMSAAVQARMPTNGTNSAGSVPTPQQQGQASPAVPNANGSTPAGSGKSLSEQQQLQNELNAKVFRRNLGNAGVIRILDLIDQVCNEPIELLSTIEYWQKITQANFLPTSILRFTISGSNSRPLPQLNNDSFLDLGLLRDQKQFELNTATAPRFFLSNILAGNISRYNISLPGLKFQVMNNGSIFMASRLFVQYYYVDGSSATVDGSVKILMNREFRIDWIDCHCLNYRSSISFQGLEHRWRQFSMNKENDGKRNQQDFFQKLVDSSESIKAAPNAGLHESSFRLMQVGDTMSHLRSLMTFSIVNSINSPLKALELFMTLPNNQKVGEPTSSPSPQTTNDTSKGPKKRKMSNASLMGVDKKVQRRK